MHVEKKLFRQFEMIKKPLRLVIFPGKQIVLESRIKLRGGESLIKQRKHIKNNISYRIYKNRRM